MVDVVIDHDERMAAEFVSYRERHFVRLHKPVKKLILGVVDYYLDLYFNRDAEARSILEGIRAQPDEQQMVDLYKQFLEFLPVRLRAGIQGRYLFQEPSMSEKQLNAERLVARDIEAEKRDEAEIMQQLGLKDPVDMQKIEGLVDKAMDMSTAELSELLSEMTGVSPDEIAHAAKEMGLNS
jgi:hypothetical protein